MSASQFAEVLNALASLAWPAFAFTTLILLKTEIRGFIARIKKGRAFGAEIDLDNSLDELKVSVDLAKSEIPQDAVALNYDSEKQSFADRVLNEAGTSPLAAFMRLSSELERISNILVEKYDPAESKRKYTLQEAFKRMPVEFVSREVWHSLQMFSKIRIRIVHENYSVTNAEILRAIDIGLSLLSVIEIVTAIVEADAS